MIKIEPTWFEDDDELVIDYESYSLGHLQEVIGLLEDSPPQDRRKNNYKKWKEQLNELFRIYNKKANARIYGTIK